MDIADTSNIKYVTDPSGKRKEVIIPYKTWKQIREELEALREKQNILLGIQTACQEIKAQEQGTLTEQTLDEFLDEL
jgi:hypothetical protein